MLYRSALEIGRLADSSRTAPRLGAAACLTLVGSLVAGTALAQPAATEAEPQEVLVVGRRSAYAVPATGLGQKGTGDPARVAQSVGVVTRDLIQDRQPRSFNEAIRTVAGVNARFGRVGSQNMRVRGFDLRNFGEYRNGLRRFQDFNLAPEIANIERFEVLKGPASVLYGIAGPGGLLNIVTFVPDAGAGLRGGADVSLGGFDFARGVADVTVPLTADGTLAARATGSFETTGGFQRFVDQTTWLASGSLAWRPTEGAELIVEAEYLRADFDNNVNGLPADGTALASPIGTLPEDFAVMDPNFNELDRDQLQLGARGQWRIDDALTVRFGTLYAETGRNRLVESFASGFVGGFAGPRRVITRNARTRLADWSSFAADVNAELTYTVAGLAAETIVGVDYYRSEVDDRAIDVTLPTLDLLAPVYGVRPISANRLAISLTGEQEWVAGYVQQTIEPVEGLRLVGALRVSDIETEQVNRINRALSRTVEDDPLVGRVGAVWTPLPELTLWASYNENFAPVVGSTAGGAAFEPEEGESVELGARYALLGGALTASLALFDIERRNVTNPDPANVGFSIQTGEQTSRGVEVELVGRPLPGLTVIGAYAYLDTEIAADTALVVGQPFQGTPEHNYSLFGKYVFASGGLDGVGVGLGILGESERSGALVTRAAPTAGFEVDGWTRVDATLSYTRGDFVAALNVQNLFDEDYISGVIGRTIVYRGEPRFATVSVRYAF